MSSHYITQLFLFFVFSRYIIGHYLDTRNKRYVLKNRNEVPEKFKDQISLVEHQKAADYTIAKINSSNIFSVINTAVLLGWTYFGGLDGLDKFVRSFSLTPTNQALAFMGFFFLISMVLSLPESLYSTFVLEEKFGFNKTTPKVFVMDMLKGIILTLV
ncbi:MAG: M48 family peptidase, partial [Bdellovibrionota bacterium]|nr:M48 family peptidase [Bdellovibrionota bacterium]